MADTGTGLAPQTPAPERVPARIGIAPTTIDEAWRLAQMFAKSALVPKDFHGKPEDVLVAIQLGTEIGFAPMQALQSIAVINGRPSVWGDGFLALIMSSLLYADHDEFYEVPVERMVDVPYVDERDIARTKPELRIVMERREGLIADDLKKDSTCAVCTFWRRGKNMPVTRRFTVAQARKANLLSKSGPWTTYPDRMLLMRARSWAGRDCYPDLLRGIRTAEEALDSGEVIEHKPLPEVRRISETPSAAADPLAKNPTIAAQRAADQRACDHKFVDSASCIKCGWTPPPSETFEIGPAKIVSVEHRTFMHDDAYYAVTLDSGQLLETTAPAVAFELEDFVGTDTRVLFTCTREVLTGNNGPIEHLDIVSHVIAV